MAITKKGGYEPLKPASDPTPPSQRHEPPPPPNSRSDSPATERYITITNELTVFGIPVEIAFRPLEGVDERQLTLMKKVLERKVKRLAPPLPSDESKPPSRVPDEVK
jgi:hypothetical protein